MIASTMTITDSDGDVVSQFSNCAGDTVDLKVGKYFYQFDVDITGPLALNETMEKEVGFEITSIPTIVSMGQFCSICP